ncbi:MAG: hypothetical protein Q4A69_09815 [Moraxella sp.]|nr:hypothetical protein [Moraxella sp.]
MNLDKLTVNVRPLTTYQAMDLGLAVARTWYGQLWRLWWRSQVWLLALMIGAGMALHFWFTKNYWEFAGYLLPLWWCKPLFERPLLVYLSQRLFDDDYQLDSVSATASDLPSLRFMLIKRFGFRRMFVMPIHLLEGQTKANAIARLSVLTRRQGNAIVWHGMVFFVAEVVLYLVAVWVLMWLLRLDDSTDLVYQSVPIQLAWGMANLGLYALVVSVLAPFFVASGFMMYLCKRSLLEGWDIELTFRKLAYRCQQHSAPQQGEQS